MRNRHQQLPRLLARRATHDSNGFTFVELLIALGINVILLAGLITIFMANISHYKITLKEKKLEQTLQTIATIMTNEIRRAGYWSLANTDLGSGQNNNPFMTAATDITINGSNNCILFGYDQNNDGSLPAISSAVDDERYGFRLINQSIQARPPGAAFDCSAASTAWDNMSDSNIIQITALSFILNTITRTISGSTSSIAIRSVDISLTGRLTSDTSITKTITQHVRIRNDKFIP